MIRQPRKVYFLEYRKCLFSEYILKTTNIVRWSTISQWLIFLTKKQFFKLTLEGGKHYLLSLNMGPAITLFSSLKFNNSLKVPASVQSLPDSHG